MCFSWLSTRTRKICVCFPLACLGAVLLTGCSLKTNPALAKIQRVAIVEFVASSTDNVPCAQIGPLAHASLESLTKNSQNPPLEFLPIEAVALSPSYRANSAPLRGGDCSAYEKLQNFDPAIGEARIQALASALHVSGLMTVSTRYSLHWGEGGGGMKLEGNSQVKLYEGASGTVLWESSKFTSNEIYKVSLKGSAKWVIFQSPGLAEWNKFRADIEQAHRDDPPGKSIREDLIWQLDHAK